MCTHAFGDQHIWVSPFKVNLDLHKNKICVRSCPLSQLQFVASTREEPETFLTHAVNAWSSDAKLSAICGLSHVEGSLKLRKNGVQ